LETRKLTVSRTIETEPELAELLNYLVDRFVTPVLQKRVVQGAILNKQKLSAKEELEAILSFGMSRSVEIPTHQQQPKDIAQGSINDKELLTIDADPLHCISLQKKYYADIV
jgi:hypothetical protein